MLIICSAITRIWFSFLYIIRTDLPKLIMKFPDFEFPSTVESFAHHTAVLKYLEDYADHFKLHPYIKVRIFWVTHCLIPFILRTFNFLIYWFYRNKTSMWKNGLHILFTIFRKFACFSNINTEYPKSYVHAYLTFYSFKK